MKFRKPKCQYIYEAIDNYFFKSSINWLCKKKFLPDITFIKLGRAEILSKLDSLSLGSAFNLQTNFQHDSLYIKINVQPDEIDSIYSIWTLITLKAKIVDEIKNTCISFIDYSKHLPNGNLPNAYFDEPAIYNGGTFLIYYKDEYGAEHYFSYVLKDLSPETQKLHNLFMNYYHENGLSNSYKRNFNINSDSIARIICLKKEIKITNPIVPKVEPPPLAN